MELSGEKLQDREGESAETRPRNEVSSSGRESRSRPLRLDPGGCYSEWKRHVLNPQTGVLTPPPNCTGEMIDRSLEDYCGLWVPHCRRGSATFSHLLPKPSGN